MPVPPHPRHFATSLLCYFLSETPSSAGFCLNPQKAKAVRDAHLLQAPQSLLGRLGADVFPLPRFPDMDLSQQLVLHPNPKGASGCTSRIVEEKAQAWELIQAVGREGAKKWFEQQILHQFAKKCACLLVAMLYSDPPSLKKNPPTPSRAEVPFRDTGQPKVLGYIFTASLLPLHQAIAPVTRGHEVYFG